MPPMASMVPDGPLNVRLISMRDKDGQCHADFTISTLPVLTDSLTISYLLQISSFVFNAKHTFLEIFFNKTLQDDSNVVLKRSTLYNLIKEEPLLHQ